MGDRLGIPGAVDFYFVVNGTMQLVISFHMCCTIKCF
jgi:hypothetical protein